ncbi:hypothetical protein FXO37_27169 [Capsicum annuum]|nr:hypothetical protein FXO37_27169 [Capsicum annuum]
MSFLGQGQVNFGEWLINDDDSFGDFLRAPNDYIDQIKPIVLEVYVRKEPRFSCYHSPLLNDVFPQLENRKIPEIIPLTQSSEFSHMTQYQNIHTDKYDFDLNKTINENDWSLPQDEMNIAPSYGQDRYFGQTSQFGSMKNAETFSNVHVSSSFGATDYYRCVYGYPQK